MADDQSMPSPPPDALVDRRTALVAMATSMATALSLAGCSGELKRADPGPSGARVPTSAPTRAPTPSPVLRGTTPISGPTVEPAIARIAGGDIAHGPRERPEVALTFHGAGEVSLCELVLRHCADRQARITVFAVGQWLAWGPSLAPQILAGGHELGNHTWSHQQMPSLSALAADSEIRRCARALRMATGSTGWWFRPSGTRHSTATIRLAASRSGYQRCVSYDVDPSDYRDPGAALVVARTLAGVRPGSIVSLHLGHAGTVSALPRILKGLEARNLQPVTLSQLLRD